MKLNISNKVSSKSGFTLVEIMIVVAIIGLLSAIAIPNFIRARISSQKSACINNLRQLDAAVQQYALENRLVDGSPVTAANITPYLGRGESGSVESVICPADMARTFATSYTLVDVSTRPACVIDSATHVIQ